MQNGEAPAKSDEAATAQERERRGGSLRGRFATSGLYFFGVVRARGGFRARSAGPDSMEEVQRVRYRDLEALVRPAPFELPPLDEQQLLAHQRTIENMMRRTTILPAPFGLVFRGRRALIHFLEDQYIVLDEALAFLEGHWELRLHITTAAPQSEQELELGDLAMHVYTELRRFARAAVPFPREERRLLTAAFLVDRSTWIDFVERTDDIGAAHPELSFDVTGPWPPYDFVRMTV